MSDNPRDDSAAGFTLIELLVYMMLIGLVLAIVGAMMINTMRTSNTVTSVTEASNAGQLVAHSVEKGIRNSSDFHPHLARRQRSAPGCPHCAGWTHNYLGLCGLVLLACWRGKHPLHDLRHRHPPAGCRHTGHLDPPRRGNRARNRHHHLQLQRNDTVIHCVPRSGRGSPAGRHFEFGAQPSGSYRESGMLLTRLAKCGRDSGSALIAVIGVMAVGPHPHHADRDPVRRRRWAIRPRRGLACSRMPQPTPELSRPEPLCSARKLRNRRRHLHHDGAADLHGQSGVQRGAGWLPGCPTAAATQVRLVSAGTAQAAGVAGVSQAKEQS